MEGLPDSSIGKESTCNAGDPSSITGLGRSPGEGIGYPLQYSWVPLVAQLVKNLPAMQETQVRSWGLEDPLEKEIARQYPCLENLMDRGAWWAAVQWVARSWMTHTLQLVKNPPAKQETPVPFLGQEDPLEKG